MDVLEREEVEREVVLNDTKKACSCCIEYLQEQCHGDDLKFSNSVKTIHI